MTKKILCMLLAVVMVAALVPMSVFAKEDEPAQTKTITVWQETDTIETGVDYLIGFKNGSTTILLMNYNPDTSDHYHYTDSSSNYYAWAKSASVGTTVEPDTVQYPNANSESFFTFQFENSTVDGYLKIKSTREDKHLGLFSNSYNDCYVGGSTNTKWAWDADNHFLKYEYDSSSIRYLTYQPSVESTSNLFNAPKSSALSSTDNSVITLWKKVEAESAPCTLTIKYQYDTGELIDTYTEEHMTGDEYSRETPAIIGYRPDKPVVSGVIMGNETIIVTYNKLYHLTVSFVMPDTYTGDPVGPFNGDYIAGETYTVAVPEINGYELDAGSAALVTGVMPADDYEFELTFIPALTLDDVLNKNAGAIHFVTGGDYPWIIVKNSGVEDHDNYAAPGNWHVEVSGGESISYMTAQLENVTAGTEIGFWYRCASEGLSFDYGRFFVNPNESLTNQKLKVGGNDTGWTYYSYELTEDDLGGPVGSCTLRWDYRKDYNGNGSSIDSFYIDDVELIVPTFHYVTINYVNADNEPLHAPDVHPIREGNSYHFDKDDFPEITGYILQNEDLVFEGENIQADVSYDVVYVPAGRHTLSVHYVVPEGFTAPADPEPLDVYQGETHTVTAPDLTDVGLYPDHSSVTVVIGNEDVVVTITYYSFDSAALAAQPGGVFTDLDNTEAYPWTVMVDEDDGSLYVKSTNEGIHSSEYGFTYTFTAAAGDKLSFDWQSWGEGSSTTTPYDGLYVYLDGTRIFARGAVDSGWDTYEYDTYLTPGTHTVRFAYKKDSSADKTGDFAAIRNIKLNHYEGVHSVTVLHQFEDGTEASEPLVKVFEEGAEYSVYAGYVSGYYINQENVTSSGYITGTMGDHDEEFIVVFHANPYVHVTFEYENGTQAAEPVDRQVAPGYTYTVTVPSITGYYATPATVTGEMGYEDITVNVVYRENPWLTINYVYADGTTAAETYTAQYAPGAWYYKASPAIEHYDCDTLTVSGYMPEAGSDEMNVTVTVTYTPRTLRTLTVKYYYNDSVFTQDHVEQVYANENYNVPSPVFDGYTADPAVVSGVMPDEDTTVTVTYTRAGAVVEAVSYTFDSGNEGFIFDNRNGTNKGWSVNNQCLKAVYDSSNAADNWAASPSFVVPANGVLTFKSWIASATYPEKLEVYVLTTKVTDADELEAQIGTESMILLGEQIEPTKLNYNSADTYTRDLGDYAGQEIQIVFHHCSDKNMYNLYVDDIVVSAPAVEDAPKMFAYSAELRTRTPMDGKQDLRFVFSVELNTSRIIVGSNAYGDTAGKPVVAFGAKLNAGGSVTLDCVGRNVAYANQTYFRFTAVLTGIPEARFSTNITATPYIQLEGEDVIEFEPHTENVQTYLDAD